MKLQQRRRSVIKWCVQIILNDFNLNYDTRTLRMT